MISVFLSMAAVASLHCDHVFYMRGAPICIQGNITTRSVRREDETLHYRYLKKQRQTGKLRTFVPQQTVTRPFQRSVSDRRSKRLIIKEARRNSQEMERERSLKKLQDEWSTGYQG